MKINKLFLAAAILAVSFTSCSNDEKVNGVDGQLVKFNSTINGQVSNTKAANNAWANGDAIGVFMTTGTGLTTIVDNATNKKYTTTTSSGTFANATANDAIYFPEDGSSVNFIAYYPYTNPLVAGNVYAVNTSNQASLEAIDLLYSNNAQNFSSTNTTISLDFTHKLSKAIFTVKAGVGITDLNGLKVTIQGMKTTADFDLATGLLSNEENVADIVMKVAASGSEVIAEAILLPEAGVSGRVVSFELPSGTFNWKIPEVNDFQEGKKHLYDVTLTTSSPQPELVNPNGTIEDWGIGSSESITLTPNQSGNTGTFASPFTVSEALSKSGETAKWVTGYIVGSKSSTYAIGTVSTNILLAEVAGETDESKCIVIDIDGSVVQDNLDIVAHPEIIGAMVKVQGDIAGAVLGATIGMNSVIAQDGGYIFVDPNLPIKFFEETFDGRVLENKEKASIAEFAAFFDMKSPVTYTDTNSFLTIRDFGGNNHVYIAQSFSGTDKSTNLVIEGFDNTYTNVTLSFDIAAVRKETDVNVIKVQFDGTQVLIPSHIYPMENRFETFTLDVPDGTSKIEFVSDLENEKGYRLDNIILKGKK